MKIINLMGSTGGGSNVEWNQILLTGTCIGAITINGEDTSVYAPSTDGLATVAYVNTKIEEVEAEIPDVSAFVTKTYVDSSVAQVRSEIPDVTNYATKTYVDSSINTVRSEKQDTLVSGTNIKTINNESLLGSGNITITGGSGETVVECTQAQYDALTPAANTTYVITDASTFDFGDIVTGSGVTAIISLTQAEYDALSTVSASTMYIIVS